MSAALEQSNAKYLPPAGTTYQYGTAGFRMRHELLPPVMFRVGVCAALRSLVLGGKAMGVMVTASHNPPEDNGVKICEPSGDMLVPEWEKHATALANATNLSETVNEVLGGQAALGGAIRVIVGRDTRASSEGLAAICKEGIEAIGGVVEDIGVVTTPELHYHTLCAHLGQPNDYFQRLSQGFKDLVGDAAACNRYVVDCANGVGVLPFRKFVPLLDGALGLHGVNMDTNNVAMLNVQCGADFVQKKKVWPVGMENGKAGDGVHCYVSLDGDADRVVVYYKGDGGQLVLLDGDQIASLLSDFVVEQLRAAGIEDRLEMGVVQTAYANGSSTRYLKARNIKVVCTATGVKHLHKAAHHFDIGVYFEANGHGTCLLSPKFHQVVEEKAKNCKSDAESLACKRLSAFAAVMNPAVGDALSDFLAAAAVCQIRGWDLRQWHQHTYQDIESNMTVVRVKDRTVIKTTPDETKAIAPPGMQELIDQAVREHGGEAGRAFVRPSGTEDVVRVYAEAATKAAADKLTIEVMKIVYRCAGGVGDEPNSL